MMLDGMVTVEINTLALLEYILTTGLAPKDQENTCFILQIRSSKKENIGHILLSIFGKM